MIILTHDTYVWETEDGGLFVMVHRSCWYAEAITTWYTDTVGTLKLLPPSAVRAVDVCV